MSKHVEIACLLPSEALESRKRYIVEAVFAQKTAVVELDNGYQLTFVGNPDQIRHLTELIVQERECCPFFQFGLAFLPNQGDVQFSITGGDGVKAYLQSLLFGETIVNSSE